MAHGGEEASAHEDREARWLLLVLAARTWRNERLTR